MRNITFIGRFWLVVLSIVFITTLSAAVPALALGRQSSLAEPWVTSVVDSLPGGSSLSIAVDENNYPHASYFGNETADVNSQLWLKYARWDGSTWVKDSIEEVGRTTAETSIVLDSQGNPLISYYDFRARDLKLAHFDEGIQDWVIEAVDTTGDVGVTNSLRLDSNDLPHIAYWDETEQRVRYASFDGTGWNYSTVEDLICETTLPHRRVSLALDTNNTPHVSYHDCAILTRLKYAVQVSDTWATTLVESGVNSGLSSSIEVDIQNRPHISYRSGNTAGGLMYAFYDGANWRFSPRVDHDFWYGNSTSIELDPGRNPRIAYTFWPGTPNALEFRFAYLTGDRISPYEVIDSAGAGSIKAEVAMAIDSDGWYHVVYWDNVTNTLKYAKRTPLSQLSFLPILRRIYTAP